MAMTFWALAYVITITRSSASANDATPIAAGKANPSKCDADGDELSALQSLHPDSRRGGSLTGSSSAPYPDRSGSGTTDTMLRNSSFVFIDLNGNLNKRDDTLNQRSVYQAALLAGPYGSSEFNALTGKRPAQILHFLELGCTVLYTDTDAVWLGDAFQDIAEAGSHDLYVTDDNSENLGTANYEGESSSFCSCFLYLQPTPAVRELVQTWHQAMRPTNNDQRPFNQALKTVYETRGLLDFAVLPYEAFPPGCYVDKHGVRPTMHVLHANYRTGLEAKRKFMVDHKVSEQLIRR